jgi:hypothetical protein
VLRFMFLDARVRAAQADWESVARGMLATFRTDIARAGAAETVRPLIDELSRLSPDFARLWRENDVRSHGEGTKLLRHPAAGMLSLEYSVFAVDGQPDLGLIVYNPATPEDADKIRTLIRQSRGTV